MTNKLNKIVSRRNLLKGAGLGALGLGLAGSQRPVVAQAMDTGMPLALHRFNIGDIGATIVQESSFTLPPDAFGGGAPEGAVADLLAQYNLPTDGITTGAKPLVLDLGSGEMAILDTGTGQNTVAALRGAGIAPEDITRVVLSHWHGDHVGGVSTDGELNFPNATYHFPQADWDFLQAADNDNAAGSLAKLQPAEDAGVLALYTAGELLPGLEAIATPGHTPGHHSLLISSGDNSLMFSGDAFNHPVTTLVHPEWAFGFDADPEMAATTRRDLLGRLADNGTHTFAYHFPFAGTGYVSRDGDVFRYTFG